MNIYFQVCGLLVIILLFVIYKTQKNLHLYRDRVFTVNIINAICTLTFDALSVVAIYFESSLPTIVVDLACKLYLCSMVCSGYSALFYVLVGVINERKRMKIFRISTGVLAAQVLSIAFTPFQIVHDGNSIYTQGIAVYLCYSFTLIFIILTIITASAFSIKKNKRRGVAVLVWMGFWCVAAIIQLLNPDLLCVAFAGALGMLVLYVMLQTPESNMDKQYACFNSYAFDVYLKDRKEYNEKVAILEIGVRDKKLLKEPFFDPIKTPGKVISWISRHSDVLIFKNVDYSIYLVSDSVEKLQNLFNEFTNAFSQYNVGEILNFTTIKDSDLIENSVELQQISNYVRQSHGYENNQVLEITPAVIGDYKNELLIEEEIKKALLDDRIIVYLQPIYSFKSKKFDTAEALVRIVSESGEIIPPGKFIGVAEKTGLIVELGERVFKKVCLLIKKENLEEKGIKFIEVNLSVVQCENIELSDKIIEVIKSFDISPNMVNFEITESKSITSKDALLHNMEKLNENGIAFSLDDFGKGESNLGYLIDMPVSILKLDMDITKAYKSNKKAKHAIEQIVELAHNIGIKVVAEGIENEEELSIFEKIGVDSIQGFVFSKPIPVDEYLKFIEKKNR